jgi:hypothetical protein
VRWFCTGPFTQECATCTYVAVTPYVLDLAELAHLNHGKDSRSDVWLAAHLMCAEMFGATRTEEVHPKLCNLAKTILIADDNDALWRVVCEAFTRESDFEVCGEAHDGHDAIEKAQRLDYSRPLYACHERA